MRGTGLGRRRILVCGSLEMPPKTLTRSSCIYLTEGEKTATVWGLGSMVFSEISPQILGLIIVRRLLDLIFSQHDLAWIDNILPEKEKKEADKKKKRKGAHEDSDEEVGRM